MLCKGKTTSIFCIIDDILKKLITLKIFAEKCLIVRLLQRHLQLLRFYKKLPYLCPVKERKDKLFFIYQILWLELVKESASSLLFFTPWFLLKGFPLFFRINLSCLSIYIPIKREIQRRFSFLYSMNVWIKFFN